MKEKERLQEEVYGLEEKAEAKDSEARGEAERLQEGIDGLEVEVEENAAYGEEEQECTQEEMLAVGFELGSNALEHKIDAKRLILAREEEKKSA